MPRNHMLLRNLVPFGRLSYWVLWIFLLRLALCCVAQKSEPMAQAIVDTIPPARDVPWPGMIHLSVDASDNIRGIVRVRETIPLGSSGSLILLYPKWLPGVHSPAGPIAAL